MASNLLVALKEKGVSVEETLERFRYDEIMYENFLEKFPKEQTMNVLKAAVAANDYSSAQEALHTLKGIADNLGFVDLVRVAAAMLSEFRNNKPQEGLDLFPKVLQKYEEICESILEKR